MTDENTPRTSNSLVAELIEVSTDASRVPSYTAGALMRRAAREIDRLREAAAKVVRLQTAEEYAAAIEELDAVLHGSSDETSEGLTVQQRVQRGLDTLEAMSNAWAESIGLEAMAANIARTPDVNKRLDAIHAFVIQAHVEGLYTGRTSLETEPPRAAEKATGERTDV